MIRTTCLCVALGLAAPAAYAQTSQQNDSMSAGEAATPALPDSYNVFFPLGSAKLSSDALTTITNAANHYRMTGKAELDVTGHTDTTGGPAVNQPLSEKRAAAVTAELVRLGVPQDAIEQNSVGSQDLLVPTGNNVVERQNRRVEIALQQPQAPVAEAAPAIPAAVSSAASDVGGIIKNGRFSLGAYYGFNMLDEGHDDGRDRGTSNLVGLNLSFDYLLAKSLNLSLEQAVFYNFGTDDDGIGGRSAIGLDYIFPVGDGTGFGSGFSNLLPYVGANFGYLYGSGIDDSLFAGPEVGLNIGPFNAKIAYDLPFRRDQLARGVISATVGLGITF